MRAGVSVEVCHVEEKGDTQPGKSGKGKGKGAASKKVRRPRKVQKVEIDDEELDELEQSDNRRDYSVIDTDVKPTIPHRCATTKTQTQGIHATPEHVKIEAPPSPHKRRRLDQGQGSP